MAADHGEQHLLDFRRLQCIWNEHFGIVAETDYINVFAGKLLTHSLDATAAITDADRNRVNLAIDAAHGHLATVQAHD